MFSLSRGFAILLLLPLAACVVGEGVINKRNECVLIETGQTFFIAAGTKIQILDTLRGVNTTFVDEVGWKWSLMQDQFRCKVV